ncbi:MAG TPA: aminotransferase class III-fold pyridoxal phosphate-dependent enzyme, partial [Sphingomonadales bacterium]|nr:aminotransferase class III-fold pyridoxal phosphate-dependent enzyme [Sphingomonadales bacterium]
MTRRSNITPFEELAESDRRHLLHPQSNMADVLKKGPQIIASGKGVRVTDAKGHTLIDGMAGLWCVNVGYGRRELAETMAKAAENLSYSHSFTGMANPPEIRLAEKLAAMAPGNLERVFFGCSGSDANDTLVKIVWHINHVRGRPQKKKIIARKWSYHGTSVASASLTGLISFHAPYNLPIAEVKHTEMPHYYCFGEKGESEDAFVARTVKALEDLITAEGPETIGAFIAEPITGAGGVVAPPPGYFEAVQKVLKKYDVLMIADEVITGFGRLGAVFGSELYHITPDLMATAKGLTSGYFPLSAALISGEIAEVLRQGSE